MPAATGTDEVTHGALSVIEIEMNPNSESHADGIDRVAAVDEALK